MKIEELMVGVDEIREISCEVGLIPRVHGSGLFTRGETQSLAVVTLGAPMDVQLVDTIFSDEENDLCYIIIFLHSLRVKLRDCVE